MTTPQPNSNAPTPSTDVSAVEVTRLLNEAAAGKSDAARELLPLVYRSLHDLAARRMRGERRDHTLQATALVHEAYMRLVDGQNMACDSRAHFYAAAAEAMRRILIDHARRVGAKKRQPRRSSERDPISSRRNQVSN